jgi:pimeloyl-ACP methyl ester carboxylesterase
VAHSSGGLAVPGVVAAIGARRVKGIVLNAASVPPEGGSGLDCMKRRHRQGVVAALDAARGEGRTMTTPLADRESLREASGVRLDDADLDFVADPSRQVADSMNVYLQPVRWSAAAAVPTTYAVNLHDRPVPVELQREMAARLPGRPRVVDLDAGHYAAITHPAELAAIVMAAADPRPPT